MSTPITGGGGGGGGGSQNANRRDGRSRAWESNALCRYEDPELWFSDRTRALARALCHSCEVLDECRAAVLRREDGLPESDRCGIVAGLTGSQRHALAKRLKRTPVPSSEPPSSEPPCFEPSPPAEPPRLPIELAPCGTRSAYQRHIRKGEPVDDACRAANTRSAGHYRRTGSTLLRTTG